MQNYNTSKRKKHKSMIHEKKISELDLIKIKNFSAKDTTKKMKR